VSTSDEELSDARMLTLTGEYQGALSIVARILQFDPYNIEALRLRGNTLELMMLGSLGPVPAADKATDLDVALNCYEAILKIVPGDTLAMKDLADHYSNYRDKRYALELYAKLIYVLREKAASGVDVGDELRDAIEDSEFLKSEII